MSLSFYVCIGVACIGNAWLAWDHYRLSRIERAAKAWSFVNHSCIYGDCCGDAGAAEDILRGIGPKNGCGTMSTTLNNTP